METGRRAIKTDLAERIRRIAPSLRTNEPLKHHTTFHIGGPAAYVATVGDRAPLRELVQLSVIEKLPLLVLGAGSNILAADHGFPGIVVKLDGELARAHWDAAPEAGLVRAGGGATLAALAHDALARGFGGLEGCAGIPGTVGGALAGNAGTPGGWIGDAAESVEAMLPSGDLRRFERHELKFAYRSSNLQNMVIVEACFSLKKLGENDTVIEKVRAAAEHRKSTQPLGAWSAGCVFRNPAGDSAGRLIDACGLKGMKFGGAQISDRHANFIVNTGSATAEDVLHLVRLAHTKVKERFNVELALEIKVI